MRGGERWQSHQPDRMQTISLSLSLSFVMNAPAIYTFPLSAKLSSY